MWIPARGIMMASVDDVDFLLNMQTDEIVAVSGTARTIWRAISSSPQTSAALLDLLLAKCEGEPASVVHDIDSFLIDMESKGHVQSCGGDPICDGPSA